MKILVLSCSTGEGHNSAARALCAQAAEMGIDADLADPVSFAGPRAARAVAGLYNRMIRHVPPLFGAVYALGGAYAATDLPSPIRAANALYAPALCRHLAVHRYDAVVSTHLYGMEAMHTVRRMGRSVPSWGVLTDYTPIPFLIENDVDGFFIPHADLAPEMEAAGVPSARLFAAGIPVHPRFETPTPRDTARTALSLPGRGRMFLLMTGGVGCGHAGDLCRALLARMEADDFLCVLAGRNERMAAELRIRFGGDGRLRVIPFTGEVPLYLHAADVVVTKPGGLTSTEAAVAGAPLVHILSVPGCETRNAAFFAAHGMSLHAKNFREAAAMAAHLAANRGAARTMRENQARNLPAGAARRVLEAVTRHGS